VTETRARIVMVLVSLCIALLVSEGIVRLLGFAPWTFVDTDRNEPAIFEYDPELGWKAKPGSYRLPPYGPEGRETVLTILPSGLRRSSKKQQATGDARPKIIFVGCSFTQGWAISDDETFAWKIQKEFPGFEVLNYGTNGYGTYQSLLLLERVLPDLSHPRIVIYGFIEHHEDRNVATAGWRELLSSYSRRAHVYVPSVTVDEEGHLVRHPPVRYQPLPLRQHSAVAALLERALAQVTARGRAKQGRAATQQLILEMRALSSARGADFAVVLFDAGDEAKAQYADFFRRNGIRAVDCGVPPRDDLVVPGEGHPNGAMNSLWAACIAEQVLRPLR
jgi:hypothetical protein